MFRIVFYEIFRQYWFLHYFNNRPVLMTCKVLLYYEYPSTEQNDFKTFLPGLYWKNKFQFFLLPIKILFIINRDEATELLP